MVISGINQLNVKKEEKKIIRKMKIFIYDIKSAVKELIKEKKKFIISLTIHQSIPRQTK